MRSTSKLKGKTELYSNLDLLLIKHIRFQHIIEQRAFRFNESGKNKTEKIIG